MDGRFHVEKRILPRAKDIVLLGSQLRIYEENSSCPIYDLFSEKQKPIFSSRCSNVAKARFVQDKKRAFLAQMLLSRDKNFSINSIETSFVEIIFYIINLLYLQSTLILASFNFFIYSFAHLSGLLTPYIMQYKYIYIYIYIF